VTLLGKQRFDPRIDSPRAYTSTASASSSSVRPRMISRSREKKSAFL
jgi:hypothetical protein